MIVFLWLLAAMGVAYGARLSGRKPTLWFVLGVVLTPLGGSLLLMAANRHDWFLQR